jgi:hypothetical protein
MRRLLFPLVIVVIACTGACNDDHGTPGALDFGTSFIYVTRANYVDASFIAGRGVHGVVRDDIQIKHK